MRLSEAYQQHFRVVMADTADLRNESFRLRHKVYCVEHGFLDALDHPDGRERDEYDSHSLHALLQHQETGRFIGTVRLVLPRPRAERYVMPMAGLCGDPRFLSGRLLPLASTAEVSRFAISHELRRELMAGGASCAQQRRVAMNLTLGLMTGVLQLSVAAGITHLCAVMEPALLRLLARQGISFAPLGPLVEYHGLRQPAYGLVRQIVDDLRETHPEHWDIVTDDGRLVVESDDWTVGADADREPAMASAA
ncbi:MAG: PEP-CTERM/exosortase system-associated acyltransferase [Alphaproteobacteria bacterium]|nr:PEP-CTERM/exosortase system-associated acyltransferase [Alphaproteobacteria bacterium]